MTAAASSEAILVAHRYKENMMDLGDILDAELTEVTDELTDGRKGEKVSNGHGGDATGRKTEKEWVLGWRSS